MEYPRTGGTENVVLEIARHATVNAKAEVVVMGSSNAFVVRRLHELSIPFQLVTASEANEFRSAHDDLFLHFSNNEWIARVAHLSGRALVWCLLAHLATGWNRFNFEQRFTGRKRIGTWFNRRIIQLLKKRHALLAMDGATAEAIDTFAGGLATPLLPIPIYASIAQTAPFRSTRPVVVSYIGRSDDVWKIYPARKLMCDLGALQIPVELEIFTDDCQPYVAMLEGRIPDNVLVRYSLGIFGSALRERISTRSSLHVSMGMSALEGALSGVPTALIDPSYSDLPDQYRYKWLWETSSFSLGRFLSTEDTEFSGHSIDALIQEVLDPKSREISAQRCIDYVVHHHSTERIVESLLSCRSTLTNRDLARWTPSAHPLSRLLGSVLRRPDGRPAP